MMRANGTENLSLWLNMSFFLPRKRGWKNVVLHKLIGILRSG